MARLIYLAIPGPPQGASMDEVANQRTISMNAYKEFVNTLFPDMSDQQFEKEGELASFLKQHASKPFELRITEDPRGSMDVTLKR